MRTRDDQSAPTSGPVRMCVICRRRFPKNELDRFTCPVHGELTLTADISGKKPGRGFYLCRDAACRNKFERFKGWQKKCKGGWA
ncbi:MAG: YlxR family protein [Deltaproteobacteria bacterium]|nr:YlxR family protein [Deltaproteobacteria bacterium]